MSNKVEQWVVIISNEFAPLDRNIYGPFKSKEEAEKWGDPYTVRSSVSVEKLIDPLPKPKKKGK